ncbi:SCP2 sterol-binding domain-containing protein [Pararhodospirillum photometricum]|uniref:SCP2 domain-containing protein n=1 Tax=Pararhodospirillum photometricum DSM 122 TaxID=1150469 RepID=H6SQS9_PARPM|nr:SCP2 sterol-binding domain-containing protein [Pararhodospirillum photometricum]CCG07394.1 Putative uncharacterized protein [Pararhodospirillum photometricum DSM 122]
MDIAVGGPNGLDVFLERPDHSLATAIVSAAPEVLLDLMAAEDGPDGDGAFFSRALRIEGDTGLVMAFRYAIEDNGMNLRALMRDLPTPAALLVERLSGRLGPLHERATADLEKAQALLLGPLRGELARLNTRVTRLETQGPAGRRPKVVSREELAHG